MHDVSPRAASPAARPERPNRPDHRGRRFVTAAVLGIVAALSACAPGSAPVAATSGSAATPTPAVVTAHGTGLTPEAMPITPKAQSVTVAPPVAYDLTPWAPPPGDQGQVGSCVAWSIAYTALGYYQRHDGVAGGALAPMYTYAQIARGVDQGSTFGDNLSIATSQGIDTLADYQPQGNFDFTTQPTAAQRTNAAKWKLSGYKVLAVDQTAISTSISTGHPVVIGIPVYQNFFSVGTANRGLYTGPSGAFAGYHALTALGYDATGLRIENSWGSRWGDGGFATLSWDFVRSSVFTAIEVGAFVPGAPLNPTTTTTTAATTTTTAKPVVTTTTTAKPVVTTTTTTAKPVVTTTTAKPTTTTSTTVKPTTTTTTAPARAVVTAVSPASGPLIGGQTVTLTGTGFSTVSAVTVGGRAATGLSVNATGTSLRIVVPSGTAGSAAIVVTNRGGASTSSAAVYRYVAPTVSAVSPRTGAVAGGTRVTVTGANLQGARVTFGTASPAVTVAADGTSLAFTTPAGTASRTVSITVAVSTSAVSAGTFTYAAR